MDWLEDERSQSDTPEYFEKKLDALDLSVRKIKRQSEGGLRRSLIVANDAIENHESFGKVTVLSPSKGKEWSTDYTPESKVETGILPFVLERKKIVLEQLEQYGDGNRRIRIIDSTETNKASAREELTKIARGEVNRRLWIVISLMVVAWAVMFFLIQRIGWNVLEPWTYLIGIGLIIVGYIYFAIQQREFSPYAIYQHALEARKKELFQIFEVDEE